MELLIGILLYLGAVTPDSTYYTSEIEALEQQYSIEINNVESDPIQLDQAEEMYEMSGSRVVVFDEPLM